MGVTPIASAILEQWLQSPLPKFPSTTTGLHAIASLSTFWPTQLPPHRPQPTQ